MSAQPKPNEPSMEEILASIRRIIADDEKPATPPEPEPSALAPVPEPDPVSEPEAVSEPDPQPQPEDDVLDLGAEASLVEVPVAVDDIEFAEPVEPAPAATVALPPPEPPVAIAPPVQAAPSAPSLDMASLISDQAGAAVHNAFGALANTVLSNNARTLEDLVKDMLKPMLKTWLDDNLPGMVERLVRAEIERVARGGRH
ncbi:DUF2497 domain-containing protein [Bosea sp. NPDC055594]